MASKSNEQGQGNQPMSQAMYDAAVRGGAKGAAGGLAVSVPTAYLLHQRWPAFRALTLPLKALFVTAATISSGIITADKSGLAYESEHYTDAGANKIRQYATREEAQWAQLSTRDKVLTWAKDNKFSIVGGSWIVSMASVGAYLQTQPMSFSQKLVQTRVWAQGLTLASLLGMAAITQIPSAGDKILEERNHASDHSWRDFVDAESSEEQAHRIMRRREGGGDGKGAIQGGGAKKADKSPKDTSHNDKFDDGSKSGNVVPGPKTMNNKSQQNKGQEQQAQFSRGGGGGTASTGASLGKNHSGADASDDKTSHGKPQQQRGQHQVNQ